MPPTSKLSNLQRNRVAWATNAINESKDCIALNQSYIGQALSRMHAKVDNCRYDAERKLTDMQDDFLSFVRKRRSVNVTSQVVFSGVLTSTFENKEIVIAIQWLKKGGMGFSIDKSDLRRKQIDLYGRN